MTDEIKVAKIEYTKLDKNTLQVENIPVVTTKKTHNIDHLLKQKVAIEKQRDTYVSLRNKELEEVNNLISEFNKL